MLLPTSSVYCKTERQQSINDFRPSVLENQGAMRLQWSTIVLLAAFLGKYAYNTIVTISQNERQPSVNTLWAGILDNLTGMEHRYTTMNLSTACICKNASDDIASASYSWAPMVRHGSESYTTINFIMLFLNGVLRGQLLQFVLLFSLTNMHAMSYWFDYFPYSCRVNS
jgi:hypothetical protein